MTNLILVRHLPTNMAGRGLIERNPQFVLWVP